MVTIIAFSLMIDLVFFKEFLGKMDVKNLPKKPSMGFFFRLFCDFGGKIESELAEIYKAKNPKDIAKSLIKLDALERKSNPHLFRVVSSVVLTGCWNVLHDFDLFLPQNHEKFEKIDRRF